MSRMTGAATARLRLALALVVGGALTLLMPSLLASTADPSAAVLVAVTLAVAAVAVLLIHVTTPVPGTMAPRSGVADQSAPVLTARVTDPQHHPLRPRAPGLA